MIFPMNAKTIFSLLNTPKDKISGIIENVYIYKKVLMILCTFMETFIDVLCIDLLIVKRFLVFQLKNGAFLSLKATPQ